MRYVTYNTISETSFWTPSHRDVIDRFVNEYKRDSVVISSSCHSERHKIDLTDFDYEDLAKMHFHYSHKNNGKSIEENGLISQIGENSEELDEEEAIYFCVGLEAVLHCWDIWLKWRLNRLNNPRAAGVKCSTEFNAQHGAEIWKNSVAWMKHMSSKKYRDDVSLLENTFEYERIELIRSDYYALTIAPGIDYPKEQFDPKKAFICGSGYAEEIYGVGVSTHLDNEFAEQWNRSTDLGKKARISPDNVWLLAAEGDCDALSVLNYLYRTYIKHCKEIDETPAQFALLPKFLEYCGNH